MSLHLFKSYLWSKCKPFLINALTFRDDETTLTFALSDIKTTSCTFRCLLVLNPLMLLQKLSSRIRCPNIRSFSSILYCPHTKFLVALLHRFFFHVKPIIILQHHLMFLIVLCLVSLSMSHCHVQLCQSFPVLFLNVMFRVHLELYYMTLTLTLICK